MRLTVILLMAWLIVPWCSLASDTVAVKGYYRKDGTYVAPYTRKAPQQRRQNSPASYYNRRNPNVQSRTNNLTPPNPSAARISPLTQPAIRTNAIPWRPPPPPEDPKRVATNKIVVTAALVQWLQEQAKTGSVTAQRDLGIHYLTGDGVEKNDELARSWLTKAAQKGDYLAYEKLKNTDYPEEKKDSNGRVIHSASARQQFMQKTGYPHGRPGYVIDHLVPVEHGGSDVPENMQWSRYEDALKHELWDGQPSESQVAASTPKPSPPESPQPSEPPPR